MDDPAQLAKVFKALSVDKRVRILDLLRERVLCVNALAALLEVTPAAVSQHLRVLREAGLVTPNRKGYRVHYRPDEEALAAWRERIGRFLAAGEDGEAGSPEREPSEGETT